MKNPRVSFAPLLLACCLLLALVAGPAFAAGTKVTKLQPPPDMRKLVKSVNKGDNTVVISYAHGKQTHTYKIDDLTAIQVDGATAKFADIKPGMEVSEYTERDNDDLDSMSLISKTHAPTVADAVPAAVSGSDKTIETVIADKSSVVIFFAQSKMQHTYHIDANTELKVNGVSGAFGDLKAGMKVNDYAERDNDDLDSLTVTGY